LKQNDTNRHETRKIVKHYGVSPGDIIHIGDSSSDIIGANEVGIVTCWWNRDRGKWAYDVKPDYEVNSLIDAASMLGIRIDP
jgi:putative hydrolase of the HAD superfamily